MRVELIKCETCNKEHNLQYCLPAEWVTITQRGKFNEGEDQHFCSNVCLVKWATEWVEAEKNE